MLGQGCLARITELTPTGFNFDCENGNWSGEYNVTQESIFIPSQGSTCHGVEIVSIRQPPKGMGHYHDIIPYMLESFI